ncbi:hypothetical protein J2Y55_005196 [Bosea sp. BE125]|uniref:hypothetical protein n=1 Tax=Bosea sp. BE125 TaxID=2817909 RepID=UPI002861226D|nr:hypothetical protein [Bosea sp. BE125]MDR6874163.1 hypothetical protein [Bosea sp. BE125]
MKFLTEINPFETALALLVILAAVLIARRARIAPASASVAREDVWTRPEVLLCCLTIALALLLSVSEVTQFMTLDETAFGEVLRSPADRNIASNWSQGASHTANLIWIPVTRALQLLSVPAARIDALLKAIHWLVGIGLIACMIGNLLALAPGQERDRVWLGLALAGVLLLLPVDNLALKTLNYDSISLFGSITGVLLVARGHFEAKPRLLRLGLLVAALAAQEKLNASLILLVLCFVVGVIEGSAERHRPAATAALSTVKAMALALVVSLVSYGIAAISLLGEPALQTLLKTLPLFMELLTVWIYAPLRFVFGIGNALADPAARFLYAWVAAALTFTLLPLAAAIVVAAWPHRIAIPRGLRLSSAYVFPIGMLLIVIVGVLGLVFVTPFWAPLVPLDPSVMSIGVMNGVQLHFGTSSATAHRVAAIGFAYGVFVAAFPTALIAAAGATALRLAWRPRAAPFFDLIFAIAVVTPGLLALLNTPTFNRYLNLPIVLAAIVMVIRIVSVWLPLVHKRRWISLALPVGLALIIAEIAPFRPLYAAFRPVTIDYPEADRPVAGHLNFSWTGWGEETILAGKFLDRECARQGSLAGVACADIGIWSVYNGRWFPGSRLGVKQHGGGFFADDAWSPSPGTYYVLNRQLVVGGLLTTFPTIPPDFVVRYRGFGMAWVYRGDRLRNSGYRFVWGS